MGKIDFEDVYTDKSTFVPWYGTLGNHDYAYAPESQFNYKSPNNDRWQLPSYYYTKRVALSAAQYATFIFIDSNPCIASYRASDPKGWDPCSGEFGECKETTDGKCHFNEHILAQDCSKQLSWFKQQLAAVSEDDWLFVVGHHEADQINVEDFTAAMLSSKMRLYLNGHTHALKHYQVDSRKDIDFFTTGAGCMVHTKDQDVCSSGGCLGVDADHTPNELFYKKASGFTIHTFADDFSSLTTKVLDETGATLYSFVTAKSGTALQPGPSPQSPSPGPSPPWTTPGAGSCKAYGCGKYAKEHSCQCNSLCKSHSDCCDDYDTVCGKEEVVV